MTEVTHRDIADLRERLARIEEQTKPIPHLVERVSNLETWRLKIVSIAAAVSSSITFVATYFASEIKRALLS